MRSGQGPWTRKNKKENEMAGLTNEEILEAIKVKPALELSELV